MEQLITIESDVSVPKFSPHGRAIGIDLGLERFLTADDGSSVERPKFLKSLKGKLRLLQMRAARKHKRSNNWEKAQVTVAKLHHHVASTRKDFHLKTAHSLCDQAQTIFAEDLNAAGLNRGMLRLNCVDASNGCVPLVVGVGVLETWMLLSESKSQWHQSDLSRV